MVKLILLYAALEAYDTINFGHNTNILQVSYMETGFVNGGRPKVLVNTFFVLFRSSPWSFINVKVCRILSIQ